MKYAIIAAVAAVAVAAPAEWDPVKPTTTSEWEPYYTTTAEWDPVKKTTTAEWEPVKKTTTAEWDPVKVTSTYAWEPVKPTTKCTTYSTYTTKEWKGGNEWEGYNIVTKTSTITLDKCPATTTTWADWVPVPTPVKCSTTSVYTTKECNIKKGDDWNKWEDCKDVTKTSTIYPTVCPTPVKVTETWAPYTTKTPVAASETWAPYTSKAPVAASTSAWSPVATFKGAADKSTFGMGALAIAAVAALL